MDPNLIVQLALTGINAGIDLIKHIKENSSLTTDQILALADAQDLKNKDDIKKLLAL
jgi:hypothetical protein